VPAAQIGYSNSLETASHLLSPRRLMSARKVSTKPHILLVVSFLNRIQAVSFSLSVGTIFRFLILFKSTVGNVMVFEEHDLL
jgi:hypothetical protein